MADAVYDLCLLTPAEITIDVVGSAIEGGRSLSGVTQSIDYSGGGFVAVTYGGIQVHSTAAAKHWNSLAAILNGSVRRVNVPLWTDLLAVTNAAGDVLGGPGGGALPNPTLQHDELMGVTQIKLAGVADAEIQGGEWFAISHGGATGLRAYRITEPPVETTGVRTVNFMPPLRADTVLGTIADFWRPNCVMRLPAGETMAWTFQAPGGTSELTVNFVEAM
jgi:hypothetical protein